MQPINDLSSWFFRSRFFQLPWKAWAIAWGMLGLWLGWGWLGINSLDRIQEAYDLACQSIDPAIVRVPAAVPQPPARIADRVVYPCARGVTGDLEFLALGFFAGLVAVPMAIQHIRSKARNR
jgi:hypothetical protein